MTDTVRPRFFRTPAAFRRWLETNHARAKELWVGFWTKPSGKGGITYPEALDEALCIGWIDGLRKRIDADSYRVRFTPRRKDGYWSAVNVRHVARLKAEGRMHPAGLAAFEARTVKPAEYSYENRPANFPPAYLKRLKASTGAFEFFESQPPGYRRTAIWWILSAKKEETRLRRLNALIARSARKLRMPPLG